MMFQEVRTMRMNRLATAALLVMIGFGLSACDEPVYQDEPRAAAPNPVEQPTQTRRPGMGGGGNAALGPAKRSAENLRDRVGQRQRDLGEEIDNMD